MEDPGYDLLHGEGGDHAPSGGLGFDGMNGGAGSDTCPLLCEGPFGFEEPTPPWESP